MPNKRIPKRLASNVDYNITSNWTPVPAEIAAKKLNKKPGKNSFLKGGAIVIEPDGQKNFASLDEHGHTMLHSAANEDNEKFFFLTIMGVENKNPRSKDGTTPLHISARKGNLRICELIIEHISDKNPKNDEGKTPLHFAAHQGNLEVCQLITRNIQDSNPGDENG